MTCSQKDLQECCFSQMLTGKLWNILGHVLESSSYAIGGGFKLNEMSFPQSSGFGFWTVQHWCANGPPMMILSSVVQRDGMMGWGESVVMCTPCPWLQHCSVSVTAAMVSVYKKRPGLLCGKKKRSKSCDHLQLWCTGLIIVGDWCKLQTSGGWGGDISIFAWLTLRCDLFGWWNHSRCVKYSDILCHTWPELFQWALNPLLDTFVKL